MLFSVIPLYLIKYFYISTTKIKYLQYVYIWYMINMKPHQFFASDPLLRLQPHGGQAKAALRIHGLWSFGVLWARKSRDFSLDLWGSSSIYDSKVGYCNIFFHYVTWVYYSENYNDFSRLFSRKRTTLLLVQFNARKIIEIRWIYHHSTGICSQNAASFWGCYR